MQNPDPKLPSGRFTRLLLKVLLVIFNIACFITFILAAITAGGDWAEFEESARARLLREESPAAGLVRRDDDDDRESFPPQDDFQWDGIATSPQGYLRTFDINNPGWLPFFFLSAIAFISWVATAILVFFVFAQGRRLSNRLPGYIFRVVGLVVLTLVPVFVLGWYRGNGSFSLVCEESYKIGQATLVASHFALLLGIFVTLLAAILDLPLDSRNDNSRRASNASGA